VPERDIGIHENIKLAGITVTGKYSRHDDRWQDLNLWQPNS
jgi:hypothetical protein